VAPGYQYCPQCGAPAAPWRGNLAGPGYVRPYGDQVSDWWAASRPTGNRRRVGPNPATLLTWRRADAWRLIGAFAPNANSLVPSVNAVVVNDAGEILLIRRTDNGNWAVPGGAIDLAESVAQAAVRETLEESGIECAITGIVGIYSDPRHVILYTSNGEARQEFSIVLTATPLGGQPRSSSESSAVRWVPASELPATRWTGRCASASTTS
jgi:ADP-ribose pyrophosphatase YjhB (NUDIX family)